MPSLLTHYLFAEDFLSDRDEGFLKGNEKCFILGAQGPDVLFFNGLSLRGFHPFVAMEQYGGKIHKSDGERFFKLLLEEVNNIEDEKERQVFLAFTFGHYAHYLLDSKAHPFIYYFSGFSEGGHLKGHYHYDHPQFEGYIDISLVGRREKYSYLATQPQKMLNIEDDKLKIISKHFNVVLSNMFEKKMPKNTYYNSIRSMRWFYSVLNSGGEWKRPLFGKGRLGALRLPRKRNDRILNEEHLEWKNPGSGEVSSKSFLELYDESLEKLTEVFDGLSSKNDIKFEEFNNEFNKNYAGIKITETMTFKDEGQRFYLSCKQK